MLDGNGGKLFSFSWEEGRIFDLWMIVHILTGLITGLSAYLIGINPIVSYMGTLAGLALYEVVEEIFNIDETIENRVADIVFGMLGFVLSYSFIAPSVDVKANVFFLVIAIILSAITNFLGWRSYKKRGTGS